MIEKLIESLIASGNLVAVVMAAGLYWFARSHEKLGGIITKERKAHLDRLDADSAECKKDRKDLRDKWERLMFHQMQNPPKE